MPAPDPAPAPTQGTPREPPFWSQRQSIALLTLATILMAVFIVRLTLERGWGREAVTLDTAARADSDPLLDINTATWQSLARLPGLGPKTAQKIVAERERVGPFQSPEDLTGRVKGLGETILAKCRPFLRFPCDTPPATNAGEKP
jgi:competence ComEA-like helix-hairpin-helix protein